MLSHDELENKNWFDCNWLTLDIIALLCISNFASIEQFIDPNSEYSPELLCGALLDANVGDISKIGVYLDRFSLLDPSLIIFNRVNLKWTPRRMPRGNLKQYSIFCALWMRINCAYAIKLCCSQGKKDEKDDVMKLNDFFNNHIQLMSYVDSFEDPKDEFMDIPYVYSLYNTVKLSRSYYDKDRDYIDFKQFNIVQKNTIAYLEAEFKDFDWDLDKIDDFDLECSVDELLSWYSPMGDQIEYENHVFYFKCLYVMRNCQICFEKRPDVTQLREYYACFVDMFRFAVIRDDLIRERMFDVYYPYGNRSFTSDDLPDLFHCLFQIPLSGVKPNITNDIVKIIQKCMPIASQKRGLVKNILDSMKQKQSVMQLIQQLFWCMLTNMYNTKGIPFLDMEYLLRADYICFTPNALLKFLEKTPTKIMALIFITCIRLWLVKMLKLNSWYIEKTKKYINWDILIESTESDHVIIQEKLSIYIDAIFGDLKEEDFTVIKNARYVDLPYTEMIIQKMTPIIHDRVFKFENRECASVSSKQNILNLLLRIPKEDRFKDVVIDILVTEKYGGITQLSLQLLKKIHAVYKENAKPKPIIQLIKKINSKDMTVIYWYFSVVKTLEKISFIKLPQNMIHDTHNAMKRVKYMTEICDDVYSIYITLCCKRICTLSSGKKYGHADISLNVDTYDEYCRHTTKKPAKKGPNAEKKKIRDARKKFCSIPCRINTPLRINLKGFMLVYTSKKSKKIGYLHCPKCGNFDQYRHTNWTTEYMCDTCKLEHTNPIYATCCMNGERLSEKQLASKFGSHTVINADVESVDSHIQHLYFCKKHSEAAHKSVFNNVNKQDVYKNATNAVIARNRSKAGRTYI